MHLRAGPAIVPVNLQEVYNEMKSNNQPPKFIAKEDITLGYPWVPYGPNGEKSPPGLQAVRNQRGKLAIETRC